TQLNSIQSQISNTIAQINAIDALISSLQRQIDAQKALIAQTQAAIDDLSRKIRFGEAALIQLKAHVSVREQLLNERLRYVDSHGSVNYVQLVLTANSINQLMNRMVGVQQIASSDRRLLLGLQEEHSQVAQANSDLDVKRGQVSALLKQQQAAEADLEKNLATQAAARAFEKQLADQLKAQYDAVQAERAAIDSEVAKLALAYDAAAVKAGGGNGVFEWPVPACGPSCMSQRFGCSSFYLEVYDPNCPYPHKIHTGIDIAAPYGSDIVAADTGVAYLYPGSVGYGNLLVVIGFLAGVYLDQAYPEYVPYIGHRSASRIDLTEVQQAARLIQADYVDSSVDTKKLSQGTVQGLVNSLGDPFTIYFDPEQYRRLQQSYQGKYTGIGIYLSFGSAYPVITGTG